MRWMLVRLHALDDDVLGSFAVVFLVAPVDDIDYWFLVGRFSRTLLSIKLNLRGSARVVKHAYSRKLVSLALMGHQQA